MHVWLPFANAGAHPCVPLAGISKRQACVSHRTAEAELAFYGKVLGFTPADEIAPVEIVFEEKLTK